MKLIGDWSIGWVEILKVELSMTLFFDKRGKVILDGILVAVRVISLLMWGIPAIFFHQKWPLFNVIRKITVSSISDSWL